MSETNPQEEASGPFDECWIEAGHFDAERWYELLDQWCRDHQDEIKALRAAGVIGTGHINWLDGGKEPT